MGRLRGVPQRPAYFNHHANLHGVSTRATGLGHLAPPWRYPTPTAIGGALQYRFACFGCPWWSIPSPPSSMCQISRLIPPFRAHPFLAALDDCARFQRPFFDEAMRQP